MGMLLQAVFAAGGPEDRAAGLWFFEKVGVLVDALLAFTEQGARFIFGNLAQSNVPVGPLKPDGIHRQTAALWAGTGAFFAFNVLPTIIFLSSLMSVLYHLGVMQPIVNGIARIMQRTMRTSGAETLSASANIFLGQTEAPLVVKPFLNTMTSSELFNVMVCGFATASGGVLAAYTLMLRDVVPNVAGHLLAATILQTPAAVVLAKIMVPGDRRAGDQGLDAGQRREEGRERDRGGGQRRLRGRRAGAQRGRHADRVHRADRDLQRGRLLGRRALRPPRVHAAVDPGRGPAPAGLGHGRALAGHALRGRPHRRQDRSSTSSSRSASSRATSRTTRSPSRRAARSSRPTRSWASRTSPASPSRSAASAAWRPDRKSEIARLGLRAMIAGNLSAFMSACWAGMLL